MTQIILARHGETEWNVAEIFRGRADVGLNETGIKQAELLSEYLRERKLAAIYSSPQKRALMTAQEIAKHRRLKVAVALGLIDFDFGEWQGLSQQDVQKKYRELYKRWLSHPEKVRVPNGESLSDVRKRASAVVAEVVARHQGTVVLVSHRVVHKVIICALLGLSNSHFWNIKLDTCAITTFSYEKGQYILDEHNNASYLKPLAKARLGDF